MLMFLLQERIDEIAASIGVCVLHTKAWEMICASRETWESGGLGNRM